MQSQLSPYYVVLRDWVSFRLAYLLEMLDSWVDRGIENAVDVAYGHPLDPVGIVVSVEEEVRELAEDEVPQYMLDDMKQVFDKYDKVGDDVVILPQHYLTRMGMTEEYFAERGIKTIVFSDELLLKPSLVKTQGRW